MELSKANLEKLLKTSSTLGGLGYECSKCFTHAIEFQKKGHFIYLEHERAGVRIAICPDKISPPYSLGRYSGKRCWNSNFSHFPKELRGGQKSEKFGVSFSLQSPDDLPDFISELDEMLA